MKRVIFPLVLAAALGCAASDAEAASCGNGVVNSNEQCDDGNTSTAVDGCTSDCRIYPGYQCTGSPSVCTLIPITSCGNGVVMAPEECDDGNATSGDGCQSDCTVQSGYVCSGSPSVCAPGSPVADCGDGELDTGEECDDGDTDDGDGCLSDCTVQDGYVCSGEPSACTATVDVCGDGIVGVSEDCDGGACCDDDCTFESSTRTCRASTGGCDPAERCTGSSATCPANLLSPAAAVCRPAVNEACDVEEVCDGTSGDCPEDVLVGCPDTDPADCVVPACDVSGECTTREECVEICRKAQFWGTRGSRGGNGNGAEGESAIDLVLAETGPLDVCGQSITNAAELGDLDAALEGLCVRPQGVDERRLYRELVAAALNCAISEGDSCDEITGRLVEVSYDECDALCAGDPVPDGPTIDECIDQLACFNEGGQVFDGECATGTCEDDPGQLCGADFGECPDADLEDEEEVECEEFEGNCADERVCSEDLDAEAQICPRRLKPTLQHECRDARKNGCTIDGCDD